MAIYSTFFLCEPDALSCLFPAWRAPRAEPVVREVKNPFTGKVTQVTSREPDWPDGTSEEPFDREYQVIAIEGDYEEYLEARLPPGVRLQPHWCAKGLTKVELAPLGEATRIEPALDVALYAPPSFAATLDEIHPELVLDLAKADGARLREIAARWAATMSTPDYTHSASGERLEDDWPPAYALSILEPIVALARQASGDQRLYLLTEA